MRDKIVRRADNHCEYCQLSQFGQEVAFHIDHVVPRALGGATTVDNLALACVSCTLRKWGKQEVIDPETRRTTLEQVASYMNRSLSDASDQSV